MRKTIKRAISAISVAAIMCSTLAVSAGALTRRLYGDVNGDGVISKADANMILEYAVHSTTFDTYQIIAADVNGDGNVTTVDALLVLRLVEGYIDEFPVGTYFVY